MKKTSVKAVYHVNGVYIRTTVNRKSKYNLVVKIAREYFKEGQISSHHPDHLELNILVMEALLNYNKLGLDISKGTIRLRSLDSGTSRPSQLSDTVKQYAKNKLRLGKYKAHRKYNNVADKIID